MRNRCLALIAVAALASLVVAGQTPAKAPASTKTKNAKSWKAPRTPDGVPDFQGYWTNNTLTPLERPKSLGSKEFYTEQEIAELKRRNSGAWR